MLQLWKLIEIRESERMDGSARSSCRKLTVLEEEIRISRWLQDLSASGADRSRGRFRRLSTGSVNWTAPVNRKKRSVNACIRITKTAAWCLRDVFRIWSCGKNRRSSEWWSCYSGRNYWKSILADIFSGVSGIWTVWNSDVPDPAASGSHLCCGGYASGTGSTGNHGGDVWKGISTGIFRTVSGSCNVRDKGSGVLPDAGYWSIVGFKNSL